MALDDAAFGQPPEYRPAPRGRFRFLTFPFRFFSRLTKRSLAGIIRTLAYHPVSSLLVIVLLAAVGFLGYQDYGAGRLRLGFNGGGTSATTESLPPSPAAEDFIKGQTTFNAALMWQSFSDPLKQQLAQRGTNQQTLQRQLDQRKQAGMKIDQVSYVGGTSLPDGSRLFVYALAIEAPNNQGIAESHYVLTVDQTDKIIKVE
jgi:hypothetical protein